jgi:hypothetical protein
VDLRTGARRPVLMTKLASVVVGFGMYAANLLAPQMLQLPAATGYGQGLSMLQAGLLMAPCGPVMMAISPLAGRLGQAAGTKTCLLLGTTIICCDDVLAQATPGHHLGRAAVRCREQRRRRLRVRDHADDAHEVGAAVRDGRGERPLNALARSLGASTASTVIGLVLGQLTVRVGPVLVPSAAGMRVCLAVCAASALAAVFVELGIPLVRTVPAPAAPTAAAEEPAAQAAVG